MTLLFTLPNGETIDLFDEGPDSMEAICLVCGEYKTPISELVNEYSMETNNLRRQQLADEIRDQAYYFAGELGSYDEDFQQIISWDELGEQIYQCLITFARI